MKTEQYKIKGLIRVFFIPLFAALLLICGSTFAQNADTTIVNRDLRVNLDKTSIDTASVKPHSPHRATIYSLVLPGLGQAYNKKYWKIPVIYAGFGVFTYFIVTNNNAYHDYRDAYLWVESEGEQGVENKYSGYNTDQLSSAMNYHHDNRDLSAILMVLFYGLNIVDAAVDAHLESFDISDDLSLRMAPPQVRPLSTMPPTDPIVASLTLSLKL